MWLHAGASNRRFTSIQVAFIAWLAACSSPLAVSAETARLTGPAVTSFDPTDLTRYQEAITRAERQFGPYSPALIEPLQAVARQHHGSGDHTGALERLRRALHLTRINSGLYEPAQIPLLEQLATNQVRLGLLDAADRTHAYLYRVQRQAYLPGSAEASAAVLDHTRWKREAFQQHVGNERYLHLLEIHKANLRVVEEIAAIDADSLAQLPHLYDSLQCQYLISRYDGDGRHRGLSYSSPGYAGKVSLEADEFRLLKKYNFRNGRRALRRAVAILERQQTVDVRELARARIALGDWNLWWHQYAQALEQYELAWQLWEEDGQPGTDPLALFAEPVQLPVGQPHHRDRLAAVAARDGEGLGAEEGAALARVRFRVSPQGEPEGIEILDLEAPDERAREIARVVLFNKLRDYRFRPVVRDGEVVRAEPVERAMRFDY